MTDDAAPQIKEPDATGPAASGGGGGEEKRKLVLLTCDYKLQTTGGRAYGMCHVDVSAPLSHLSFKRVFPLSNPNAHRCALFAMLMAFEIAANCPEFQADEVAATPDDHKYFFGIVVKRRDLWDQLFGDGADATRVWAAQETHGQHGRKGVLLHGFKRPFYARIYANLDYMRMNLQGDAVYVPEEGVASEEDVLLSKHVDLDVDPKAALPADKAGLDPAVGERITADAKKKDMLVRDLVETGVAGVRTGAKLRRQPTKAQKKKKK